jgi:hypothetical protein
MDVFDGLPEDATWYEVAQKHYGDPGLGGKLAEHNGASVMSYPTEVEDFKLPPKHVLTGDGGASQLLDFEDEPSVVIEARKKLQASFRTGGFRGGRNAAATAIQHDSELPKPEENLPDKSDEVDVGIAAKITSLSEKLIGGQGKEMQLEVRPAYFKDGDDGKAPGEKNELAQALISGQGKEMQLEIKPAYQKPKTDDDEDDEDDPDAPKESMQDKLREHDGKALIAERKAKNKKNKSEEAKRRKERDGKTKELAEGIMEKEGKELIMGVKALHEDKDKVKRKKKKVKKARKKQDQVDVDFYIPEDEEIADLSDDELDEQLDELRERRIKDMELLADLEDVEDSAVNIAPVANKEGVVDPSRGGFKKKKDKESKRRRSRKDREEKRKEWNPLEKKQARAGPGPSAGARQLLDQEFGGPTTDELEAVHTVTEPSADPGKNRASRAPSKSQKGRGDAKRSRSSESGSGGRAPKRDADRSASQRESASAGRSAASPQNASRPARDGGERQPNRAASPGRGAPSSPRAQARGGSRPAPKAGADYDPDWDDDDESAFTAQSVTSSRGGGQVDPNNPLAAPALAKLAAVPPGQVMKAATSSSLGVGPVLSFIGAYQQLKDPADQREMLETFLTERGEAAAGLVRDLLSS